MFTYETLSAHPRAFVSLTGLQVELFGALHEQFVGAHAKRLATTPTKRTKKCGNGLSEAVGRLPMIHALDC